MAGPRLWGLPATPSCLCNIKTSSTVVQFQQWAVGSSTLLLRERLC